MDEGAPNKKLSFVKPNLCAPYAKGSHRTYCARKLCVSAQCVTGLTRSVSAPPTPPPQGSSVAASCANTPSRCLRCHSSCRSASCRPQAEGEACDQSRNLRAFRFECACLSQAAWRRWSPLTMREMTARSPSCRRASFTHFLRRGYHRPCLTTAALLCTTTRTAADTRVTGCAACAAAGVCSPRPTGCGTQGSGVQTGMTASESCATRPATATRASSWQTSGTAEACSCGRPRCARNTTGLCGRCVPV